MKKVKLIEDFKAFAFKGNVVDMAVGVVIGSAFSAIVSSLVNDIIMPLVGLLTKGTDFSQLQVVLASTVDENGETVVTSALRYGQFIQYILNFFIIAFSIFVVIKLLRAGKEKKEAEEKAEAEKKAAEEAAAAALLPKEPTEKELLAKIVDILEKK